MSDINEIISKELGFPIEELTIDCGIYHLIAKIFIRDDKALMSDGRESSIYLPDSSKEIDKFTNCVGRVIYMHPSCYSDEKFQKWGPNCKLGDWIYFKRGNGDQVNFKGHSMMVIWDDLVLGKVENPRDIRRD